MLLAGALVAVIVERRADGRSGRSSPTGSRWRSPASSSSTPDPAVDARRRRHPRGRPLRARRHDLLPVEAYFLGRGLALTDRERDRLVPHGARDRRGRRGVRPARRVPRAALVLAATSAGWFQHQLGLVYDGLSRAAGELRLQRGQQRRLPAAHLDVPLAARDLLPARRRAAPALSLRRRFADARSGCCSSPRCSGRTRAPASPRSSSACSSSPRSVRRALAARCSPLRSPWSASLREGLPALRRRGRTSHPPSCATRSATRSRASRSVATTRRARTSPRRSEHLAQPPRRPAHGLPPPVGLRARQRRASRRRGRT